MKVLVYQVKIGEKSFVDLHTPNRDNISDYNAFEKNICNPSVEAWARKCGYDYKMYNLENHTFEETGFFCGDMYPMGYFLSQRIQYIHQDEYDYVIYLDNDIYVNPNAPEFPISDGFSGIADFPVVNDIAREKMAGHYIPFPENYIYFNSGVYGVDKMTGNKIKDYFYSRFNSGESHSDFDSLWCPDQTILNQYFVSSGDKINYLSKQWNGFLWDYCRDINCPFNKSDVLLDQPLSEIYFYHFLSSTKNDYVDIFDKIKNCI
jgi:hypothetical protein